MNEEAQEWAPPPEWWIEDYAHSLVLRAGTATLVPREIVTLPGWQPEPNRCHDNAVQFADRMPGHSAVHGWLVFDAFEPPYLVAHSVVQRPDGTLMDITPSDAMPIYRFLPASIPAGQYSALHGALFARFGHGNLNSPY